MYDKEKANPQQWVASYADYLYAFALKRIPDPELCKDLVQDTFMSAIKNLSQYKGKSSEQTWLTSVLKNKISDHYRKKLSEIMVRNDAAAIEQADNLFETNGHWKHNYMPQNWGIEESDYLENKELKNILDKCIKKLPALWAMVFNMKYMDEEDSKIICKEMALTASNFWVIVHRSKLNLRARISKHLVKVIVWNGIIKLETIVKEPLFL